MKKLINKIIMKQNNETEMESTAKLANTINSIGFSAFNHLKVITRNDILSSYSLEALSALWKALSEYIMKNYESGRGTYVKGFGTFTFTNIDHNMEGTTNQFIRDKKIRKPVFLVSNELNETLHPGQYTKAGGLIYYTQKKNNSIPIVKLSTAELAFALNISKEECGNMLHHLFKDIDQQIRARTFTKREMPGLGVLMLRANVFGMKFLSDFSNEVKEYPQKKIFTKKNIGLYMDVYKTNGASFDDLKNAEQAMDELRPRTSVVNHLENNAEAWLKDNFNINVKKDVLLNKKSETPFNKVENLVKGKLFNSQQFFFPKKATRSITASNQIKDLDLPLEVLKSFISCKGQIIKEMKIFDRRNNGLLPRFDIVRAIKNANVNPKLSMDSINNIVNIYGKGFEFIDYFKLITCLIKDCKILLKNEPDSSDTEVFNPKFTLGTYYDRTAHQRSLSQSRSNMNYSTKFSKVLKEESKDGASIDDLLKVVADKYKTLTANIEEVENEIKSIKIIFAQLMPETAALEKNTHRDNVDEYLGKFISYIDLGNILHKFSITYPNEKILKVLKYIKIEDPTKFRIENFNKKLNECKLTSYEMKMADINNYFSQMINIIKKNGGKGLLFPSQESQAIDLNTFIKVLKPKTNFSENVLETLFKKFTGRKETLTIEDYNKLAETDKLDLDPNLYNNAIVRFKAYLKKEKIRVNELFNRLLMSNPCRPMNAMTKQHFITAIQLENFEPEFAEKEISYIFDKMDFNKDGILDRAEFKKALGFEPDALGKMQDIIKEQKLNIEDLAYRFDIDKDKEEILTFYQFKTKLKKIDTYFTNDFIESLYIELVGGLDKTISTKVLLDNLNVYKKEIFKNVNNESFKNNFIKNIQNQVDFHTLKQEFEKADTDYNGKISKSLFCDIIHLFSNEYLNEDILKFVRITNLIDKFTYEVIYYDFLNLIYYNSKLDLFLECVEELKKRITGLKGQSVNEKIKELIKLINKETNAGESASWISNDNLFTYFKGAISKPNSNFLNKNIITKFDLDSDGKVDYEDLKGIINRYISSSFFKYENSEKGYNVNLYANDALNDEDFKRIVREIKKELKRKNVNDIGLFKFLDEDNDGFISNYEFNKNITKYVDLAPSIKDKVFNYLDYYHNGLIDLRTFLFRFKEFKSSEVLVKNNNKIENEIIDKFSEFIRRVSKNLRDAEIFSLLDKDADGQINLADFKHFVLDSLTIPKSEFNESQLERVLQSISLTKNKNISLGDIKEFIKKSLSGSENGYYVDLKETFKETTNPNLFKGKKNTEWINQCIERLGMFISEKFESIEKFYELYSDAKTGKFKFENFESFNRTNYECFFGFNLTFDELLDIFTSLDSQKKNYLTLDDFKTKLSLFDFYKKMHFDIKLFFKSNFPRSSDAFKFFLTNSIAKINQNVAELDYSMYMTKKEFFEGINILFPNKYSTETILKYYKNYFTKAGETESAGPAQISFPQFTFVYYDKITPSDESFVKRELNKLSKISTIRSKSMSRTTNSWLPKHPFQTEKHFKLMTPFDSDPIGKLKRIIISSNKDYISYIKQKIEESGTGIVNLHEFKFILKYFNIGLTGIEIEDILKGASMTRDGKVNLNDLLYLVANEDKNLVKASSSVKMTIAEIKQLLYKYYSNPKLAFEFSDSRKLNKMDFDKFRTIVCEMYAREGKKIPNFALLKTTFDFIDLRKDGVIDINEWSNSFGRAMGKMDLFKRSAQADALRLWETSDKVIEIYKAIARSRKFLWEKAKGFTIGKGQGNMINANNLINILQNNFPDYRLTNTQWKMIVDIAKNDISGFIDFDLFISIVEHCANKQKSQPRFN